jgi:hypothetical protein
MLRAATLCTAMLAVTAVAAQGPPAPAHVRFRAIGADGAPVADLQPAEVTLKSRRIEAPGASPLPCRRRTEATRRRPPRGPSSCCWTRTR